MTEPPQRHRPGVLLVPLEEILHTPNPYTRQRLSNCFDYAYLNKLGALIVMAVDAALAEAKRTRP